MTVRRFTSQFPPSDPSLAAEPLLLSQREAAGTLGISERLLWTLTSTGEVPHVRIGRRVLYRLESLKTWLAGREQRGASAAAAEHPD